MNGFHSLGEGLSGRSNDGGALFVSRWILGSSFQKAAAKTIPVHR